MTIPKDAGLSRLADVCNEQALTFHYPIKQKGQPRRLRPNLDAIRYLEIEQEQPTEIFELYDAGEALPGTSVSEYKIQRANGWYDAKRGGHYPRPMFQTFDLEISSSSQVIYPEPCPACDDWSRTSRCEEHHDLDGVAGLRMGADRRSARNERREGPPTVYSDAPQGMPDSLLETYRRLIEEQVRPTDGRRLFPQSVQDAEQARQEAAERQRQIYQRITAAPSDCTCSMCQRNPGRRSGLRIFEPVEVDERDPNRGRPGYHYDFAQNRWVPDTNDPLGDFRAGGEVGAGAYIQLDSVPEELLGPTRDRWLDRITGLADFAMTLEITGDTTQASASTVRIEVERNDGTT